VTPQRSVDRDTGMRRISTTTRWLAGIGVGLVGAFSVFFASQASSGSGATPVPATAAPSTQATVPPATGNGSTVTSPTAPPATYAPVTYPPTRHTTSRGS